MRKVSLGLIVTVVAGALIALLAFLHSEASGVTFLLALDEILLAGLRSLWDFAAQPVVAGILLIFILLRYFLPSSTGLLSIWEELTASVGPFSVKGKLDSSRFLSQVETEARPAQRPELRPEAGDNSEIVGKLDPIVAGVLVDLANREMSEEELVNAVSRRLMGKEPIGKSEKAATAGFVVGVVKSFNGILLNYSSKGEEEEFKVLITIDRAILEPLYERLKSLALEEAPENSQS